MDEFLKNTIIAPPTHRQKKHQILKSNDVDTSLTTCHKRYNQLVTIPNPKLLEINSVELRRYHERAIVNNRYKSLEWSAIALLLVADIISSNSRYNTSKSLGLEYSRLALDIINLFQQSLTVPDMDNPTPSDIQQHTTQIEKQVHLVLDDYFKDTGTLSKNGRRSSLSPDDIDSLIEKESFVLKGELDEGLIHLTPKQINSLLNKRLVKSSGYSISYVRRLRAESAERELEKEKNNLKIEKRNRESDDNFTK